MTLTSKPSNIGILGGTFDPIHEGHIQVADACADRLGLDSVLMIPSNLPPHRPPPQASAVDRLAMVRLAVEGHPRLLASDVEVRRGGVSYTVDTIRTLAEENLAAQLTLLLGWDAAAEFRDWHQASEITGLARIAVFNRSGSPGPPVPGLAALGLPSSAVLLEVESPLLSATEARRMVADGEIETEVLAAPVVDYIREHRLYRGG